MPYRFADASKYVWGRAYEYAKSHPNVGPLFLGKIPGESKIINWPLEIGIATEVHAVTVGSSGSGKGTGLLVQNCIRWPQNLVCIDPKGQNARLAYPAREKAGHRVGVWDPFEVANVPDRLRVSFNPLAAIDPKSRFARSAIEAIANGLIVVHDPKHMDWIEGGRALLSGILARVIVDNPPETRTFGKARAILMQPSQVNDANGNPILDADGNPQGLYADAQRMANDGRMSGLIREAGNTLMTALESSKGMEKDFIGNVKRATRWLDDENIAAALEHSTIQLSDLKSGDLSLFVVLPADADIMATYAPFLRLAVKSSLNAMTGNGKAQELDRRCLFLLDECYSLGKLDELVEAVGRIRDAGVHLWPFFQTLSQPEELYGIHGTQTLFANADAHIYLGNDKDHHTLRNISLQIGDLTPEEIAPPFEPGDPWGGLSRSTKENPLPDSSQWKWNSASQELYFTEITAVTEKSFLGVKYDSYETRNVSVDDRINRRKSSREYYEKEDAHTEARRKAEYEYAMKRVRSPRLAPEEIAALIGKGPGDNHARSMIVFLPASAKINIQVAPYYENDGYLSPEQWEEERAELQRSEERRREIQRLRREVEQEQAREALRQAEMERNDERLRTLWKWLRENPGAIRVMGLCGKSHRETSQSV